MKSLTIRWIIFITRLLVTIALIVLAIQGHKWALYSCLSPAVIDAEVKSYIIDKLRKDNVSTHSRLVVATREFNTFISDWTNIFSAFKEELKQRKDKVSGSSDSVHS